MCADIRTVQISFKKIQPLLRQFPIRLPDAVYNDVILAIGQNTTSSTGVWKKLLYKSFSKVMRVLFFYLF